jgi:hypothetical protein
MTREEIRKKYLDLMNEIVKVKGDCSRHISEEFAKLHQACSHPYGQFNYEIGCWACPDCGLRG